MLESIFTFVDSAVKGAPALALSVSLLWGILSILLSPCHLSGIPLIVGYMSNRKDITTKQSFAISSLFSIGILITQGIIGALILVLGFMFFSQIGTWGNLIVSLLFFVIGLYLLGIIPLPFLSGGAGNIQMKKRGLLSAFILGLVFGLALGPCSFAYMMPVLGAATAVASAQAAGQASKNIIYAGALILFYAIGHCGVIVFAGTFYKIIERYLKWNEESKALSIVKKICGILLILAGIYMLADVIKILIK